ncbi:MAG: bifunctional hydroxymethylpyrimidine kinase/phosphomethylpyrimidine kinase [Thermoprotei archaeon]|nr:MAG: bifunctional hydroxymethylpyrimidine kinase/phosphomethylpyrimidine kinase [Thermoprotei archaeon]
MSSVKKPSCLSIAGLDPSGGAGVIADAKTFIALGFHAACIVAALTFQNTRLVKGVIPIPSAHLTQQIEAVLEDLHVVGVKVGVLYSAENIEAVSEVLSKKKVGPLVVDPVIKAKRGERLIEDEGVERLRRRLLPLADVATPNVEEAEELVGFKLTDGDKVAEALRCMRRMGVKTPVIKGWRRGCLVEDLVLHEDRIYRFERPRHTEARGGGCVFSAAVASFMAKGLDAVEAVREAGEFTRRSIEAAIEVGGGFKVTNPLVELQRAKLRLEALDDLRRALRIMEDSPELALLMPEVRMNLAVAIPGAEGVHDVCAVEGRITEVAGKLRAVGCPSFGASSHMARLLLEVIKRYPQLKAALNVKFSPKHLEACKRLGFRLARFERAKEPEEVRVEEGRSLVWGVQEALKTCLEPPDAIYDEGGWGKEAMIRLLGESAVDVVNKARRLAATIVEGKA